MACHSMRTALLCIASCRAWAVLDEERLPTDQAALVVDDECSAGFEHCGLNAVQLGGRRLSGTAQHRAPEETSCLATSFTLTYGLQSGVFALPGGASEGDEVDEACAFDGYTFALGTVKFACKDGHWHYKSDTCAACNATTFALSTNNDTGHIALPVGMFEGAELKLPCAKAAWKSEVAYGHGLATFACQGGQWVLSNQTCAVCGHTDFKLDYGRDTGTFSLPRASSEGFIVERPCKFDDKEFPKGVVRFACTSSGWNYSGSTCSACDSTSLAVNDGNFSGAFDLPTGTSEGQVLHLPCSQPTYKYGSATFTCRDGQWEFSNQTCAVCRHSSFKLKYGSDIGLFALPDGETEGLRIERPCNLEEKSYPFGAVNFACTSAGWSYQGDTCAACPETTLTHQLDALTGNFTVPRTLQSGFKIRRPCVFGEKSYNSGFVQFACNASGWEFDEETCAACGPISSFNVTYGADHGIFQLPSAASDGIVLDRPCSFGSKTYETGSVKFQCRAGHWQLKTVTCMQGKLGHGS
eukprot:gb/GFBE01020082.1/.p1 GENE.gb/GFBE01020082.1/~~gb/GFBE01020082.1/.p1  ORF type:complete len:524 (+),score=86.79 gb/GFBE01020082.1/:1-1572(+)